jgi:hypothetical protein
MNKRRILIVGGIVVVVTLLVGVVWGWAVALTCLAGVFLLALVVFSRMTFLKYYLGTYSLRTMLYTKPTSAELYSSVDPHNRTQPQEPDDLNALFPSQKMQEPDELPPFHFAEGTQEENKDA